MPISLPFCVVFQSSFEGSRLHRLSALYFSQTSKETVFFMLTSPPFCFVFQSSFEGRLHRLSVLYFSQTSKETVLFMPTSPPFCFVFQSSKKTVFFMLALPPFYFVFQLSFERALYFSQASKETLFFMPALPPFCFVFKSGFEGGRIHSLSPLYFSQSSFEGGRLHSLVALNFSLTSEGTVFFMPISAPKGIKCVDPHLLCFTSTSALLDFVYCLFSFIPALCFSQTLKETVFFMPISPPRGVGGA